MLMLSAATDQRAEALSLISPGTTPAVTHASGGLTTEVRGGGHGGGGMVAGMVDFTAVGAASMEEARRFTAAVSTAVAPCSMAAAFTAAMFSTAAAFRHGGFRVSAPPLSSALLRVLLRLPVLLFVPPLPGDLDLLWPAQDLPYRHWHRYHYWRHHHYWHHHHRHHRFY